MSNNNLVIIGMPGSGKSTFGKRLAREKQLEFIDTDLTMEREQGNSLQVIVDRYGVAFMRQLEEDTICALDVRSSVIATGGSVVYSERAMQHLTELGTVIYLQVSLPIFLQRVNLNVERGLFKSANTTLPALYHQRKSLYDKWAEVTLNNNRPLSAMHFTQLLARLEHAL